MVKQFLIAHIAGILLAGCALADSALHKATFAGGCFWCIEAEFAQTSGVNSVTSGYTGGHVKNPTYRQVVRGATGHVEAVEVTYDPARVSYNKLLEIFWDNIDPLDKYGQFCDRGEQYRAAIFTHSDKQKALAEQSRDYVQARFKQPVATSIREAQIFYPAEEDHQAFYRKNKETYKRYRQQCGNDARLEELRQMAK